MVDDIYPMHGSIYGGTTITLSGVGFGSDILQVEVMVGDIPCLLKTLSDTTIVCQIGKTANTVFISNTDNTGCKYSCSL